MNWCGVDSRDAIVDQMLHMWRLRPLKEESFHVLDPVVGIKRKRFLCQGWVS